MKETKQIKEIIEGDLIQTIAVLQRVQKQLIDSLHTLNELEKDIDGMKSFLKVALK